MHGALGEARTASRARSSFPSMGFYLSLPGYAGGSAGLRLGYHKLDFRAPDVMQGHNVSGMEEMRARYASFECGRK